MIQLIPLDKTVAGNGIMLPTVLKYEIQVQESGWVEFNVPFSPGSRLMIFVVGESSDKFDDLMNASQSSLDFWDNPFDDEDWLKRMSG